MAKESKKTFVLRLDAAMYQQLEKWAADEFRSVNGQLEYLIARALKEAGRSKNEPAADVKLPEVQSGKS
jgi:hypothetical protein